jgi:hypothetical protein
MATLTGANVQDKSNVKIETRKSFTLLNLIYSLGYKKYHNSTIQTSQFLSVTEELQALALILASFFFF